MIWTQVTVAAVARGPGPRDRLAGRGQVPGPVTSVNVIVGAGLQLSVAVAVPVVPGSVAGPHAPMKSGGQVITGGVVSLTVNVCVQVPMFPHASTP